MDLPFTNNRRELQTRLCVYGLSPRDAGQIMTQILKWERYSGTEWTISRLKSLKVWYIQHKSGNTNYVDPYIRTNRDGFPSGPWGRVMKHYDIQTVLYAIMIYSYPTKKGKPTKAQLDKFFSSMEKEPVHLDIVIKDIGEWMDSVLFDDTDHPLHLLYASVLKFRDNIGEIISQVHNSDHGRIRSYRNDTVIRSHELQSWISSKTRKAPVLSRDGELSSVMECELTQDDLLGHFYYTRKTWYPIYQQYPDLFTTMSSSYIVKRYFDLFTGFTPAGMALANHTQKGEAGIHGTPWDLMGRISFIQEPGYKLRAVANPFRGLQSLTFPLGYILWESIKGYETNSDRFPKWGGRHSFVYDQKAALPLLQEETLANKVLNSVDLSDATNNFPWDLQKMVLRKLDVPECHIVSADTINKGTWKTPDGSFKRFTVGQPLGAYFSFSSFHLSHLVVAWYAAAKAGVGLCKIYMVGDDIVISDKDAAAYYIETLEHLGVPVSKTKTITSQNSAEFLSKFIHRGRVYDMPKWSEVTMDNVLSLFTNYPDIIKVCPPHIQKVVLRYAELPEPFGLGMNPHGKTLECRLGRKYDDWVETLSYKRKPMTGLIQNKSSFTPTWSHIRSVTPASMGPISCEDFSVSDPNNRDSRRVSTKVAPLHDSVREHLNTHFSPAVTALAEQGLLTSKDLSVILRDIPECDFNHPLFAVGKNLERYLLDWYKADSPPKPISEFRRMSRLVQRL